MTGVAPDLPIGAVAGTARPAKETPGRVGAYRQFWRGLPCCLQGEVRHSHRRVRLPAVALGSASA
jgi:hypothetical protein